MDKACEMHIIATDGNDTVSPEPATAYWKVEPPGPDFDNQRALNLRATLPTQADLEPRKGRIGSDGCWAALCGEFNTTDVVAYKS